MHLHLQIYSLSLNFNMVTHIQHYYWKQFCKSIKISIWVQSCELKGGSLVKFVADPRVHAAVQRRGRGSAGESCRGQWRMLHQGWLYPHSDSVLKYNTLAYNWCFISFRNWQTTAAAPCVLIPSAPGHCFLLVVIDSVNIDHCSLALTLCLCRYTK